jgi:TRAP-type C4-dicarboxylate transport system permease small subunit
MLKFLKIIDKILSLFEEWTLFIATMLGLLVLFVAVVLRYTISYTIPWSQEIVREVIIYTTFIGCSVAIKNRAMLKIDALIQVVPKLKTICEYIANFGTVIFSLIIIKYGWKMVVQQYQTHQYTIILQIPIYLLYLILPIMGILMLIRVIQVLYEDFTKQKVFEK